MEPGTGVLQVTSAQLAATPPRHALQALTSPHLGRFLSTPVCLALLGSSAKEKGYCKSLVSTQFKVVLTGDHNSEFWDSNNFTICGI